MGSRADATIAYGYDLGSLEDFRAAERGEWGEPNLTWWGDGDDDDDGQDDDGDDDSGEQDFAEALITQLLAANGFTETWTEGQDYRGYSGRRRAAEAVLGIEVEKSGSHDYPGYLLIATGSDRSVSWAKAMTLDLDEMSTQPEANGWNDKLRTAVAALGITPTQGGPAWVVFPFYG